MVKLAIVALFVELKGIILQFVCMHWGPWKIYKWHLWNCTSIC